MPDFEYGPEVCTCGAKLPPDARFCHKCGKPQRDEPMLGEETQAPVQAPPEPPALAPAPPPRIGFHNVLALRAALLAWLATTVGSTIFGLAALPQALLPLWLPAGGFFAVYLYKRRTGQRLSVIAGAHLGWLSGLLGFIVSLIALAVRFSDPSLMKGMRDQLQASGLTDANIKQVIDFVQSAPGVLAIILALFFTFSGLPAFGGALGAKILGRDSGSQRG